MTRDLEFEETLVRLLAYLKATGQEAHTTRSQTLIIKPRHPKKSRLTGEPR